ncbi:MAG TPA: hypothetical protein VFZ68_15195 [Acidimicrobiales bacterium]
MFGHDTTSGDDGWPWEDRASGHRDPYATRPRPRRYPDQRTQAGRPGQYLRGTEQYPPGQPGQYPPGQPGTAQYPAGQYPSGQPGTAQYPPSQYPPGAEPYPPGQPGQYPRRQPGAGRRPPGQPGGGGQRRRPGAPGRNRSGQARPSPDDPGSGLPVGAGALLGVAGLICFVLALAVLPWFTAGGRDVALSDIRTAFTVPESDVSGLLPDTGDGVPFIPSDGVPGAGQVADQLEEQARDTAAEAAGSAIDTGKSRYLELYADVLWMVVAGGVALSVLFSTILAPRSLALSLLLGFRAMSGFVTVLAGAAHGAALWVVFSGSGAPDPAFGVWLGVGGLGAVLLGCIVGPKR